MYIKLSKFYPYCLRCLQKKILYLPPPSASASQQSVFDLWWTLQAFATVTSWDQRVMPSSTAPTIRAFWSSMQAGLFIWTCYNISFISLQSWKWEGMHLRRLYQTQISCSFVSCASKLNLTGLRWQEVCRWCVYITRSIFRSCRVFLLSLIYNLMTAINHPYTAATVGFNNMLQIPFKIPQQLY